MKVLFIYSLNDVEATSKPVSSPELVQFGISYISSLLKGHGHETRLIVLNKLHSSGKNRNVIDEYLGRFYPKLICFTAVSTEYQFIAQMAAYIKGRYPDIYLVVGGPHVSLNPGEALTGDFDAICIGEGEHPVLELVSQMAEGKSPSGIPNLWIKHDSEIERNSPRQFLQKLDELTFPDREMWREWIAERPGSRYSLLLGRGCPFRCTYCCNHALKKLASGPYVRFRSPGNIVAEIEEILTMSPEEEELYLEVESFGVDKKWAIGLCTELARFNRNRAKPLSFGVNLRVTPNADLEDIFNACKAANFKSIQIGLESGSERVRHEILRREYSNDDIINAVGLARKYGLEVTLFNMVGIPGETLNDFKETVEVNRICQPNRHFTSIFYPYPGTDLYSLCEEQGLLEQPMNPLVERQTAYLDLPGFSKKQIHKSYIWFDYYVYKGYRPILKVLARVLLAELRSKAYIELYSRRILHSRLFRWLRDMLR